MESYIMSGLAHLYKTLTAEDASIEFLDPISTIVKLGIIGYKPIGSKVSVKYNTINIQDQWILQGLLRWYNSDERNQIYQLKSPVLYYSGLLLGHIAHNLDTGGMRDLLAYAIDGLKQLRSTYETSHGNGSMIKTCINEYITILSTKYSSDDYQQYVEQIDKMTPLFTIYAEFMKKWSNNDIFIIIRLFKSIDTKDSHTVKNAIADSIDKYISSKDYEIDVLRP